MGDLIRHFRNMALNNQWANRRLLNACAALEPGEFSAPRTGFATFAYRIRSNALPRAPGTVLRTASALAKLGRSPLWFAHRTVDGATGEVPVDAAQFGVHLDRAARRPAEIPDGVRQRMQGFLS